MKTCCWVLSPNKVENGKFSPAKYCGKPAIYSIVKDDDGNKIRKYSGFCESHSEETISAESICPECGQFLGDYGCATIGCPEWEK